jgi:hypothetical protein
LQYPASKPFQFQLASMDVGFHDLAAKEKSLPGHGLDLMAGAVVLHRFAMNDTQLSTY